MVSLKIKLTHLIFFVSIFTLKLFSQTIVPGGAVSGIWTSASEPYFIQGDIYIPIDSTLNIESGVNIIFQGHYYLKVQGRLLAIGTETDSIKFTVNDTTGFSIPDTILGSWNGIRFIDIPAETDSSKIIFCDISFAKAVSDDHTESCGGGLFISDFDKILIADCKISNCSVYGSDSPSGGALYCSVSNINLMRNEFSNNRAADGGAILIWDSDPIFQNNLIASNTAETGGGGIWIGGNSNPEFNFDTIQNNISGENGGGIICWQNTHTILNSVKFSDNKSNWGAGVGVIDCAIDINNCVFDNNGAISLAGGLGSDFSTVKINDTKFSNDTSGFLSGAIHSWHSSIELKHCLFEDNESDFGGAIHSDFSELLIDSTTFIGNKAIDGGAIHTFNTNLLIDSIRFIQNEAVTTGGAIQYHIDTTEFASPFEFKIMNSLFLLNSAFYRGALDIQQFNSDTSMVSIKIDKCEFSGNEIDRGGNLLLSGHIDDFEISNSLFKNNSAILRTAGCLFNNFANGVINNCLFVSNNTVGGSSAASLGTGSKVNFINCTFADNIGANGAALTIRNDGHAILMNNIFWDNEPYNITITAVSDSTPCFVYLDYNDMQFGLDSIIVNDNVSIVEFGSENIDLDPLFINPIIQDYHLQDLSPSIAAGIDTIFIGDSWIYSPTNDIEGNPRPNPAGTMPDIGAYESPLPQIVNIKNHFKPINYSLSQNYPNPFNPTTVIKYSIPNQSNLSLKVFDILGNEIAELVNEEKPTGNYIVEFDASRLSSGVYFYRLQSGNFVSTKKMLLLK